MNERDIFIGALEIESPEEQAAFLDQACAGDSSLGERVEALLRSHAKGNSLLENPPAAIADPTLDQPITEKPGTQIGPYKLLQQVGEGGMGVVYMAEQKEPFKRRVALKIIKPGMDTRQVIARFEAERQALAMMDHPNIAKVLDAGATESGRPYFVMELVNGLPVTKYCDEQHLTPKERLELFVPICQAVQHAHQKGIIHRDLKPSNILVALYDGQPVPKVIDFGVAKATSQTMTEKTMFTQLGQVVGTLDYMSPEQAERNQLDIDTRSDIYSLGVVLYELLTGETPFDRSRLRSAAFDEMLRIIREEEPSKPSTKVSSSLSLPSIAANRRIEPGKLGSMIRGELDWIVLKAMEKDRGRRYETASKFAEDVQHYLNDEAVVACPPSARYRFNKFARRNKALIGTSAAIAVALMMVLASLGWAIRDRSARKQQALREQVQQQSRLAGRVDLILNEANRLINEKQWLNALAVAKRAEAAIDVGEPDPLTLARVEKILSDLILVRDLEAARLVRMRIAGSRWNRTGGCEAYAHTFDEAGLPLDGESVKEAEAWLSKKERIHTELVVALTDWAHLQRKIEEEDDPAENPRANWLYLLDVADAADSDPWRRQLRAAYRSDDPAAKDLLALTKSVNFDTLSSSHLALLGMLLADRVSSHVAADFMLKAHERHPGDFWINVLLGNSLSDPKLNRSDEAILCYSMALAIQPDNAGVLNNLGMTLHEAGRIDDAIAVLTKAIDKGNSFAYLHANLARSLHELDNFEESCKHAKRAIELDPDFGGPYNVLGNILFKQEKFDDALAQYRKAIELDPKEPWYTTNLGVILTKQKKTEEAIACFERAIELDPHFSPAHTYLGIVFKEQGEWGKAVSHFQQAVELAPLDAINHVRLGIALEGQRNLEKAMASLEHALELDPNEPNARNGLGNVFLEQGKIDEAIAKYREAIELDPEQRWYHTNLALALGKRHRYEEAIASCHVAIELDVDFAPAHHQLGYCLLKLRKLDEAIDSLRRAIELDPDSAAAHHALGDTLKQQGQIEEAIEVWRKAIELQPEDSAADDLVWNIVRFPNRSQADYEEALRIATKRVDYSPERGQVQRNLGIAHYRNQHWDEAIEILEKLEQLVEEEGLLRGPVRKTVLAMAYWQVGQREKASVMFDKSIACFELSKENDPERLAFREEAAQLFGVELNEDARRQVALALASRQLQESAVDAGLLKQRGNLHIQRKNWQQAVADFTRLIKITPDDQDAHLKLARVCRNVKNNDRAIEACNAVLYINPGSAHAYYIRGSAYQLQKNYSAALADLGRSIQLDPSFPWSYSNRGELHAARGEWRQALDDFREFHRRDSTDGSVSRKLALLFLTTGDRDGYHRLCADLLEQYKQKPDPAIGQSALECALLSPDGLKDYSILIELAEANLAAHPESHTARTLIGAAQLRAGQTQALEQLESLVGSNSKMILKKSWLALARIQAGKFGDAQQLLNVVDDWLANSAGVYWSTRLENQILLQEAKMHLVASEKSVAAEKPDAPKIERP